MPSPPFPLRAYRLAPVGCSCKFKYNGLDVPSWYDHGREQYQFHFPRCFTSATCIHVSLFWLASAKNLEHSSMASIPRALRGLKPFLGMRLSADERTNERRESIWSFAQSNESSTLVGCDSLDTPFAGLSRTIRYAASLLYAKQPLNDSSEEPCQPQAPERKHLRPSLKGLTWRTSSSRALKHKCSFCSTKTMATADGFDQFGKWPRNNAAPHLDVFIPDSSLRGKTGSMFEDEVAAPHDPAGIMSASEDDLPSGARESTTTRFNQTTQSQQSLIDRFDGYVTVSLDKVNADTFTKHIASISTKDACQKETAGGEY